MKGQKTAGDNSVKKRASKQRTSTSSAAKKKNKRAKSVDISLGSIEEDGPIRSLIQASSGGGISQEGSCMGPSTEKIQSLMSTSTISSGARRATKANFDDPAEPIVVSQASKPSVRVPPKTIAVPPTTFFDVVLVPYKIADTVCDTEVHFSLSMVVRFIGRNSCLLPFLLVGDQILEVNGNPILASYEFNDNLLEQAQGVIRLIRPWNNIHLGNRQPQRKNKDCCYLVVKFHKFPKMSNGFEIVHCKKICEVTKTKTGQRGAHAFFRKDRLLDVDSVPIAQISSTGSLVEIRKRFNKTLRQQNMCSFLVERPLTLRSSANASLIAARTETPPSVVMGDDAAEIGAREATRIRAMRDVYKLRPIRRGGTGERTSTHLATSDDEDSEKKRMRKKKKKKKAVSYDGKNNRCSKVPSDVKDGVVLTKVTPKSGIIGFVKNFVKGN